jgi:eukaryotic-like serine/threonine-protein kinase
MDELRISRYFIPQKIAAAESVALGIACALDNAHRLRIIHRDIKPDNILMTEDGLPKLGD